MIARTCPREAELQAALRAGRWPAASDAALRDHVAQCRSCSDVALVMHTMQQARAQANTPALQAPGTLWWRAQLRRRQQAVEQATRPIVLAEIAAFAAVFAGLALSVWHWWHAATLSASPSLFDQVTAAVNNSPVLFLAGAFTLLLVFSSVVLYVAAARD